MTSAETLLMYVNDMIALERDLKEAADLQIEDTQVSATPGPAAVIHEIASTTSVRLAHLQTLAEELGSGGKVLKDAVAAAAGTLAGLYGKVRKHPLSRMLRDDYTALALASTAYSMLYTTALALRDGRVAALALAHLQDVTPLIMQLSRVIPEAVVAELAEDFPELDRSAGDRAREATFQAWTNESATA